ncbi:MAG: hypothetical protein GF328_15470 [Candidatus Latescibacteria bacterium]|nr:hypothetical protein [Candidatus Latescibacterota bacterium]
MIQIPRERLWSCGTSSTMIVSPDGKTTFRTDSIGRTWSSLRMKRTVALR